MKNKSKLHYWGLAFIAGILCLVSALIARPVYADSTGKYVIVLDPGHSGTSTGASATFNGVTYKEEVITWKLAAYIKQELAKYPNIEVYLTRNAFTPDNSIANRVTVAKNYGADLLVSLHLDSSDSSSAKGASLLISNGNYRSELAEQERIFGAYLQTELKSIGLNWRGYYLRNSENGSTYPNGKIRDYYGIVANSIEQGIPGVIIEHCFITNASDVSNYLSSDAKIQKLALADANAIVSYCKSLPEENGISDGWHEKNGSYYYYKDGSALKSQFLKLSSGLYYLDSSGKRVTGWQTIDGDRYCFATNGRAFTGWRTINGNRYFFNVLTGAAYRNLLYKNSDGTVLRYFDSNGVLAVNKWVTHDSKTYYMDSDGVAVKGWYTKNGDRYYFSSVNFAMYKNMLHKSSTGYIRYFDEDGVLAVRKWVTYNNKTYYMNSAGYAVKSQFLTLSGKTYYFDQEGVLYKGWLTLNGKRYYLSSNGVMKKNGSIKSSSGITYVFDKNGVLINQY
jgi:glucan-binding YG repeat protein